MGNCQFKTDFDAENITGKCFSDSPMMLPFFIQKVGPSILFFCSKLEASPLKIRKWVVFLFCGTSSNLKLNMRMKLTLSVLVQP